MWEEGGSSHDGRNDGPRINRGTTGSRGGGVRLGGIYVKIGLHGLQDFLLWTGGTVLGALSITVGEKTPHQCLVLLLDATPIIPSPMACLPQVAPGIDDRFCDLGK